MQHWYRTYKFWLSAYNARSRKLRQRSRKFVNRFIQSYSIRFNRLIRNWNAFHHPFHIFNGSSKRWENDWNNNESETHFQNETANFLSYLRSHKHKQTRVEIMTFIVTPTATLLYIQYTWRDSKTNILEKTPMGVYSTVFLIYQSPLSCIISFDIYSHS